VPYSKHTASSLQRTTG